MSLLLDMITKHWFAALLLGAALVLVIVLFVMRARRGGLEKGTSIFSAAEKKNVPFSGLILLGAAVALFGAGGLLLGSLSPLFRWLSWSWVLLGLAAAVLFAKVVVLILTSRWSAPLGYVTGMMLLFALGGLCADALGASLAEAIKVVRSLTFKRPWWLLLLGLVPLFVATGLWSLAGLGSIRRWVVLSLASATAISLTMVLAEACLGHQNENTTVIFVVDQSFSIPAEPGKDKEGRRIDRRRDRIEKFINNSVNQRGLGHERDQAAVIRFGRWPRLELPPASVKTFNFKFKNTVSIIDGNHTDIAAALKLALASFPENTGKRIVLISDGNENLGNAKEQAEIARKNGVQIDVLPLAAGQQNENEVLVQSIEAPERVEVGTQVPIRIFLRSYNPNLVVGRLSLSCVTEDAPNGELVAIDPKQPGILNRGGPGELPQVILQAGINSFTFKQAIAQQERSYTYEAEFQPGWVQNKEGQKIPGSEGLPGDRPENNRATAHVVARGARRVLVIEPEAGQQQYLIDKLRKAGTGKFQVKTRVATSLPQNKDALGVFLSGFDSVILANVPAEMVSEGQQEVIASNTRDQGCGLIMIGGPKGFGAGGWRQTAVEKALPVDCDIQSLKVQGKGGLVLIMHASEIANGNMWQKKIAKLAIEKLSSADMCGVIYYGTLGNHVWHIPFQQIGDNRRQMLALVDSMSPADMQNVDPALKMAQDALTDPQHDLATRHIIFISDGDHWEDPTAMANRLASLRASKITCSTVCVTSHGKLEEDKMRRMALATGGRAYVPKNPNQLPAIYVKETRLASQGWIHEKEFVPLLRTHGGPLEGLASLPPLRGYVRTTAKRAPTVQKAIVTPPFAEQDFPILAYWHYGLGKAVAFTSDASQIPGDRAPKFWASAWYSSPRFSYVKFWEQVVDWSLRPVESQRLTMRTEYRDGKVRVIVEAREDKQPVVNFKMEGAVTLPNAQSDEAPLELKFEQTSSGVYVAEFKSEETGSYFITARAARKISKRDKDGKVQEVDDEDSVRSGVTIPYSPEFSDMECNVPLLENLRILTHGNSYQDSDEDLTRPAKLREVFRAPLEQPKSLQPVWSWLLLLTGLLLLLQVAVRRITIAPAKVATGAVHLWDQLRGRVAMTAKVPEYFDRLRSRKAEIGEGIKRDRAARRFEGDEGATEAPTGVLPDISTPSSRPVQQPGSRPELAPEKVQEEADYASRLLKAKKRIWQERDQEKEQ